MMNEELFIEKLLLKYRFTEPVPAEYRNYIAVSKSDNLIYLLKKNKNFNLIIWAALLVFMLLRKIGISVSFIQAAVISGVTAAVMAVTVTTGTAKAVSVLKDKINKDNTSIIEDVNSSELIIPHSVKKSVTIMQFTGTEDTGILSRRATSIFADTLSNELGESNLSYGNTGIDKKYIITGSVEKLPEGFLLTTRVIDKSTSMIIHMDMKEISREEFFNRESLNMAKNLAGLLK